MPNIRPLWTLATDVLGLVLAAIYGGISALVLPLLLPPVLDGLPDTRIRYGRARFLPPSLLVVRDLHIRAPDRVGTWTVRADAARASVDLLALASRTLRLRGLTGEGIELTHVGFADGRTREPAREPWSLTFRDLELPAIERFGVGQVRLQGDPELAGTLRVTPDQTTFDGRVRCAGCTLRRLDDQRLAEIRGEVELTGVAGPRGVPLSLEVLRHASGHARVSGTFSDLRALRISARLAPWAQLVGAGTAELDLEVEDGGLLPGSTVRLHGAPLGVRLGDYVVSGEADVRLAVEDGTGPGTHIEGTFEDYQLLDDPAAGPALAHGTGLTFEVRTPSASLTEIHSPIDGWVGVPPTSVPDLTVLDRWIPRGAGLDVRSGAGTATGKLSARVGPDPYARGHLTLDVDDARFDWDEDSFVTDARAELVVADGDLSRGALDLLGTTLAIRDLRMEDVQAERTWWADVEVLDGRVLPDGSPLVDLDFAVACQDSSPITGLLDDSVAGWIRQLLTRRDVRGRGRLRLAPDRYELDDLDIAAGRNAEVRLHVRRGASVGRSAAIFARLGLLSVGVRLRDDQRDIHLFQAASWYEEAAREF